jgi:hypothetical protein
MDDDAPASPEGTGGSQDEEPSTGAAKVQIMGLHTRNPFVSYNGHVFSCQWASNLGTELHFTEHDPESSLPVLRKLTGGVDLLAASSARIISNPVILEPKPDPRAQPESKKRKGKNKESAFLIPVGPTASDQRKGQARFLEKLMEIKEAKGEQDDVTVYTSKRLSRTGWKKHFQDKRNAERKTLQKIVKARKKKDTKKIEDAKVRLAELDREEERMNELEQRWLKESRPMGRGRIRVLHGDSVAEPSRKRVRVDDSVVDTETPKESLSTPTPQRWGMDENGGFFGENDVGEDFGRYDEDVEEEMFYEDEYGAEDAPGEDEDAPGEDEDTQLAYGWS